MKLTFFDLHIFEIAPDPTPSERTDVDRSLEKAKATFDRAKGEYERYSQLAKGGQYFTGIPLRGSGHFFVLDWDWQGRALLVRRGLRDGLPCLSRRSRPIAESSHGGGGVPLV